jgi:uncharacterized protein
VVRVTAVADRVHFPYIHKSPQETFMDNVTMTPPPAPGVPPPTNRDQNMWAMFCHLSALAGFVIPFGHVLGPLVIWLMKKDEYPLVDDQGKEALNFQISMTIYLIVSAVLIIILIGILLLIGLAIFEIIVIIMAMVKANEGVAYRYPLTIRFIK